MVTSASSPFKASDDNDSRIENLPRRFLRAGFELHEFGKRAGYRVIPTTDPTLPLFRMLPYEKQLCGVNALETYCGIYRTVVQEGKDIRNNSSVVWATFRALGLVPPSNLFDKMSDEDVVEVYSFDNVQLFANFRFFDFCSYTIEQVYSLPLTELWHRDEDATAKIIGFSQKMLEPESREAIVIDDCIHRVVEIASPFKYVLDYQLKAIAPLWDKHSHQKSGFVAIERAKILNKLSPSQEESLLEEFYQNVGPSIDLL